MSSSLKSDALKENWNLVLNNIRENSAGGQLPTLVAVSKTKPASDIQILYDLGQRHFGENYVHEITEKAKVLPSDIKWHFIGHLQSNKIKELLLGVPNLHVIETVDSIKKANAINKALQANGKSGLGVYLQVNSSGEDSKSGADPDSVADIVSHILRDCPNVQFRGLMTIGSLGNSLKTTGSNPDFVLLEKARDTLLKKGLASGTLELSMGMSSDYIEAIKHGSTSVRVGSKIFGSR